MFEAQFQTFEDAFSATLRDARLAALRGKMAEEGLSGFIVPRADQHQNEYVAPSDERLAWISGFTGSAGLAVILAGEAALFVDGRYTLQAAEQADGADWAICPLADPPPETWITAHLRPGDRLGFDPWLHTPAAAEKLTAACAAAGAELVPVGANLIDAVWTDRPLPPSRAIALHGETLAGQSVNDKLAAIRAALGERCDALVLSDPHAVAWAFNIRGSDVAHTPIPLVYAIIPREGAALIFAEAGRLSDEARLALADVVRLLEPATLAETLADFGKRALRVGIDGATAAEAIRRLIADNGGTIIRNIDPVALLKAVKNPVEIAGSRAAHLRDGLALSQCLAWLSVEAPRGHLTEIDVVESLETFRRNTGLLRDISFPTISGSGPNGAIVHYRVTRASNRRISPGELLLLDSGAQYQDGTTDVTRTIAVGEPSTEMRSRFTRVLKGHIAIARAVFPDGISGAQIDSFARQYLWQAGLDFDHGTGHGIGSYLSVHEGPARISKLGTTPLKRGMILSNEPGYYKTGSYGIRIENLVLVQPENIAAAEREMNGFETLTLAPIDLTLIDKQLMTPDETRWLNAYHAEVLEKLAPLADEATRSWLEMATRAI